MVSQEFVQYYESITVFDRNISNSGCQSEVKRKSVKLIKCTLFVLAAKKKDVESNDIKFSVSECTDCMTSGKG
jgi:hypothetical protein